MEQELLNLLRRLVSAVERIADRLDDHEDEQEEGEEGHATDLSGRPL